MSGFHLVARKATVPQHAGTGAGAGARASVHGNANHDGMESDFSSEYDQPYHETASHWYSRHMRHRARGLTGISSSSGSGSSSDDNSVESEEYLSGREYGSRGQQVAKRMEMEKAALAANRLLAKWLGSYPIVAAGCCLSIPSTMNSLSGNNIYGKSPLNEEFKRLHRIFRRMRHKNKQFQAKFMNSNNLVSSKQTNVSEYQESDALRLYQIPNINQDSAEIEDQLAIHSFLPQGTGISFIDAVLARESHAQNKSTSESAKTQQHQPQKTLSRLVLELNGPSRSGMTSIMLALAARYVACTSTIFLKTGCNRYDQGNCAVAATHDKKEESGGTSGQAKNEQSDYSTSSVSEIIEPRVVILDIEKGVHAVRLVLSVREAVLRRWEETAAARKWKRKQERRWKLDRAGGDIESQDNNSNNTMEDHDRIELAIASCLGRIHVVQPRDFTYLSLVATIEALGHSLDEEQALRNALTGAKKQANQQLNLAQMNSEIYYVNATKRPEPPTLILIDSLNTLDASTRFQESLPTNLGGNCSSNSNGLSDRNEFYRQLVRLREAHEIAIFGASRYVVPIGNRRSYDQSVQASPRGNRSSSNWNKMVSHRVTLHYVAQGTQEAQAGYEFVATLNSNDNQGGVIVFPYSVTAGGISCQ